MTEAEAKKILTEYGAPANIAQHIEAIRVAGSEDSANGDTMRYSPYSVGRIQPARNHIELSNTRRYIPHYFTQPA